MSEAELQKLADEAGKALGRGWADFFAGRISPAELGQLKRREDRAQLKLRAHRYATVAA